MDLCDLPNIGAILEAELIRAGVETPEELKELGAREAFIRLRMRAPDACLNRLYALAGGGGCALAPIAPRRKGCTEKVVRFHRINERRPLCGRRLLYA